MLTLTSPVEIWAHRLPAGAKLAALCVGTVVLFGIATLPPLVIAGVIMGGLLASGGAEFAKAVLRLLWPLWPFAVVLAVWHGWTGDVEAGLVIAGRLAIAVTAANFVTMTTRLSDMLAVIERLCQPLARIGVPPRLIALAMALVIRFIPVMAARLTLIRDAWRARSPRKPGWRVLTPMVLAALDDADHVAEALRARGGAS